MAKLFQFRLMTLLMVVTAIAIVVGVGKVGYDAFLAPPQQQWFYYSAKRLEILQRTNQTAVLYFYPGDVAGAYMDVMWLAEEPEMRRLMEEKRVVILLVDNGDFRPDGQKILNRYTLPGTPSSVILRAGKWDAPVIRGGEIERPELIMILNGQ